MSRKLDPTDLTARTGTINTQRGLSAPIQQAIVSCWDDFAANPGSAYVVTGDGGQTDIPAGTVTLVITDPPYMDNVHYSELADFFHAWLRGIGPYPEYPTVLTTRDEREVQNTDAETFRTMAADVWRECARVLSDDGLLIFSFHQSRTSGWEAVMRSLADAGLVVTAVRPVVAEVTTSLTKAAASAPNRIDVIVVCRKAGDTASTGDTGRGASTRDDRAAQATRQRTGARRRRCSVGSTGSCTSTRNAQLRLGLARAAPCG